jgi:tetratricopeptide (TPR) repeat protein
MAKCKRLEESAVDGMSTGPHRERIEQELAESLERLQVRPTDRELNRHVGNQLYVLQRFNEAMSYYQTVIIGNPDDAAAWQAVGMAASHADALETARQALERAVALGRDDGTLRAALASVYQRLHQPAAAIEQANRALHFQPSQKQSVWIHALLADCYESLGDQDAKLRHRQQAVEADPGHADAEYNLGAAYSQHGCYAAAVPHLEKAATLDPENPENWYSLGMAASHADALETARQALEQAIALGRDDGTLRAALASVYQRLHQPAAAIEQAHRALHFQLDQRLCGQLHSVIGACYAEMGDTEGALVHLQKAVHADPEDATDQHNLGMMYARREQFAAALPHLTKAAALLPHHPGAWYDLGRAARRANALDTAREAFEKALALGQDDGDLRLELAWVLQRLHQPIAAIEQATQALRFPLERSLRVWAHAIMASSYADLEDAAAQLDHRRRAVRADPQDADSQYNLGVDYRDRGDFQSALPHLERAVALVPEDIGYQLALAHLYVDMHDYERAEPSLRQLLDSDEHESAHILLVQCALAQGHVEDALHVARGEVEGHPASAVAWAALSAALRADGDRAGAQEALRKAETLDPDDPWVAREIDAARNEQPPQ